MFGDESCNCGARAAITASLPPDHPWSDEHCWQIQDKEKLPLVLEDAVIRWPAMAVSYADYERVLRMVQENWFKKRLAPYMGGSYSYRDGSGRIYFEKPKHAFVHFEALKAAGVVA